MYEDFKQQQEKFKKSGLKSNNNIYHIILKLYCTNATTKRRCRSNFVQFFTVELVQNLQSSGAFRLIDFSRENEYAYTHYIIISLCQRLFSHL